MQLIFILWLDSKGLLGEWIEEVLRYNLFWSVHTKNRHIVDFSGYVSNSFIWDESGRGAEFWKNIHKEWLNLAEEIKKLNTK